MKKFIESFDVSDWEVETDTGWTNITHSNKTIPYEVWKIKLDDGQILECADNHIVFTPIQQKLCALTPRLVSGFDEIFVKDLTDEDAIIVKSDNEYGFDIAYVESIEPTGKYENMYDLSVDGNHRYFTNDILSHNTMFLSNLAMSAVKSGKNVVYITFEISRDQIFSRYTGAFTDMNLKTLNEFREEAKKRAKEIYDSGTAGEFVIQEYSSGSISALEIDTYLGELKMKKNFTPDLIVVDYLGIMKPINTEVKGGYEKGKEVCENLRWLSYKYNCPVYSASQANRGSYGQERVGMDDVSDSLGISMTADLMIGITHPPEFQDLPQLRGEIIKSRLSGKGMSFIIPIDKDKLKILNESVSVSSEEQKTAKLVQDLTKKKTSKPKDDEEDEDSTPKSSTSSEERNSRGIKIK